MRDGGVAVVGAAPQVLPDLALTTRAYVGHLTQPRAPPLDVRNVSSRPWRDEMRHWRGVGGGAPR